MTQCLATKTLLFHLTRTRNTLSLDAMRSSVQLHACTMGWESYVDSYRQLGDAVANAVRVIEGAGMQLIHKRFRAGGSR